ncbi:MAG: hypothetical protein M1473_06190 [Firmicutes bacterium]|nr:hypothetical protein [Bacillota bacterium]
MHLWPFLRHLSPLSYLSPLSSCWLCRTQGADQSGLCSTCYGDLPRRPPRPIEAGQTASRLWIAALTYQQPVTRWLRDFKFNNYPGLAVHMAPLMAAQVIKVYQHEKVYLPDILVPVPLSDRRWLTRGYNQSRLLANEMSSLLGIPIQEPLQRRHTGANHLLNAQERKANLEQAFVWREPLRGKRVAIIDDVITSGATVEAMAQVLRQTPCVVDAWSLAYTQPPESDESL